MVGLYERERLVETSRLSTRLGDTADDLKLRFQGIFSSGNYQELIRGVVISSVVPPLESAYKIMSSSLLGLEPCWVEAEMDLGMPLKIDQPGELGADRLANAIAAYEKYGGPAIIVDLGTAITFCLVSRKGEYLGGSISPGVRIAIDALHRHTSKLPSLEFHKPSRLLGTNTRDGILSGVYYGTLSLVEGMINRFKQEKGFEQARVIATGGLAGKIAADSPLIDQVDENLILEGLRLIYQRAGTV